jgi:hypothetical protein
MNLEGCAPMNSESPASTASLAASSREALFTPFTLRNMTVRNRIVMAPMTRGMSPGGVPGKDVAA